MARKTLLFLLSGALFAAGCVPLSPVHRPVHRERPVPIPRAQVPKAPETIQVNELRVLLKSGRQGLKVSAPGGLVLLHGGTGREVARITSSQSGKLEASNDQLLYADTTLPVPSVRLSPLKKSERIKVDGHVYRGQLVIRAANSKLLLINEITLDEYLYGVLSSEVPPNWPWAALRAQAVAARTYALFRSSSTQSPHYDLDDSTSSQVYSGTSRENKRTTRAVDDTSGLVLVWGNKPAQAFFHSNCGGHTAASRDVWGTDIEYLRGVKDNHCARGKHARWEATLSTTNVEHRLKAASKLKGNLQGIYPYEDDFSGRWNKVRIDGTGGKTFVKSSSFRLALGADVMRSTRFQISGGRSNYLFTGRGWGHGIGMCQEGARGKADKGWTFDRILSSYYPGTKLESFEDF